MSGRCAVLLALVLGACESGVGEGGPMRLDEVLPSSWLLGAAPTLEVRGRGFHPRLEAAPGRPGGTRQSARFTGGLGGRSFLDLRWVDNQTLVATAPPSLRAGQHDLVIVSPAGQRAELVAAVRVVIDDGGEGAGGDADLGDGGGDPGGDGGAAPSITTLSDSFSDGTIGPAWAGRTDGPCCQITASPGDVRFTQDGSGPCRCELTSVAAYDLTGAAAAIRLAPIDSFVPELSFFLAVVGPAGDRAELRFRNDLFESRILDAGAVAFVTSSAYPPEPWIWRLREAGGTLWFESSLDQVSWEVEASHAPVIELTAVQVSFGYDAEAAFVGPIAIGVAAFNP